MKIFKIVLINIFFFIFSFFLIEIFFGYWLDKDNLGPYMREHRMKKNSISVKFNDKNYNFVIEIITDLEVRKKIRGYKNSFNWRKYSR